LFLLLNAVKNGGTAVCHVFVNYYYYCFSTYLLFSSAKEALDFLFFPDNTDYTTDKETTIVCMQSAAPNLDVPMKTVVLLPTLQIQVTGIVTEAHMGLRVTSNIHL